MKNIFKIISILLFILYACHNDNKKVIVVSNLNTYSISAIVVDKSNTKWIGTSNGLYKSVEGGYSLEDISIPGEVNCVYFEGASNTLWVGTNKGMAKVAINASGISSTVINSTNLSNDTVLTAYVDSSSRRWFGTADDFTLNINTTWKKAKFCYNLLNNLVSLEFEGTSINSIASWNGDYYFATNTFGLYRARNYNDTVDAFTGATQWSTPYNGTAAVDTMFTVFVDSKGRIWMGGTNGVQYHTGHDSKQNITPFLSDLPNPRVHAIAEATDGKIWVGTENGIAIYDGTNWTTMTAGLANLFITAIAFDSNGSAWVGTQKGLYTVK